MTRPPKEPIVSIIIPTFNESWQIGLTLDHLCQVRGDFEVLLVDGESTDGTPESLEARIPSYGRPLRLLRSERNRALQLNRGARLARGRVLLFLHADALLPPEAIETLEAAVLDNPLLAGGSFTLRFRGDCGWSRFFSWVERQRRRFGIYYGDSGVFVRRDIFKRLGGFKPIPIMDDYEFVRRLEKSGHTACLAPVLQASDRRWRVQGAWHTMWTWFWVQLFYSLGVPAGRLARWYKPVRETATTP